MQGILEYGTQTFLVRFWVEPREVAGEPARVPARVEHVGTGRAAGATTPGELIAFIGECLESAGVPVTDAWRSP